MESFSNKLSVFFKGMAMGAADVIPGVSGGTIAFITGIYQELVDSIGRLDQESLKVLFKKGPLPFYRHINGPFLLSLGLGIILSIVALAKFISTLLAEQPVLVWSFFFGLIIASAVYIGKDIKWTRPAELITFIVGACIAYVITTLTPSGGEVGLLYVFMSGAIAISAMILPGISGSFILLLLGSYATVLGAIGDLFDDLVAHGKIIVVFAAGALIGLIGFSKILRYLFKSHYRITIAMLTGFMLGSLAKVWPWKETLSTRINSKGEEVPLLQDNIWPTTYAEIGIGEPLLLPAIGMFLLGLAIVYLLSRMDHITSPEDGPDPAV
ncbi:MAG: DUF368 domain-containing protein [Flavobacteriales bacterium]|nr:DUF368 domain-containing protein [Flavobacteriales bacterium]